MRGAVVGSRAMMEDMVAAIEANDIHPVVDSEVFTFDQAKEAYQYLVSFANSMQEGCGHILIGFTVGR